MLGMLRALLKVVANAICWDGNGTDSATNQAVQVGPPVLSCICKPLWGLDLVRAQRACRVTSAIVLSSVMTFVPAISAKYPLAPWAAVTVGMVADDRVGSSFGVRHFILAWCVLF